jgi:thiamine pyrophosphokinase
MVNAGNKGRLGIVFTGGNGPEQALLPEAAGALIVAADSGLLLAEKAGLTPDWIIGDMDSAPPVLLDAYAPEKILRFPKDKDYTDTELAFSLLREKGCGPVWIIGGGGGRIDHLFALRAMFERDDPPERWITAAEDIRCLEAPAALEFTFSHSAPVSVFPLGGGPWEAESGGLKWPLTGLSWNRGFFGLSNEAPEGAFYIRAKKGRFLVILENHG